MKRIFLLLLLPIAACNPFEAKMIGFCEQELIGRLRSPSTYKRVEAIYSVKQITIDQWWDRQFHLKITTNAALLDKVADLRKRDAKPTLHSVFLSYDASNAYGTPIRSTSFCEYLSEDDKGPIGKFQVRVDGKTALDLIKKLRQSN